MSGKKFILCLFLTTMVEQIALGSNDVRSLKSHILDLAIEAINGGAESERDATGVSLKIQSHEPGITEVYRLIQLYLGVPVDGYQILIHKYQGKYKLAGGTFVNGIEAALGDIQPEDYDPKEAIEKLKADYQNVARFGDEVGELVIYVKKNEKTGKQEVYLAFKISFLVIYSDKPPNSPQVIVDANTGQVLEKFDQLTS